MHLLEESFVLTVNYKGTELDIPGILRISAYTHQFILSVSGTQLVIEKDDEQNLRAFLPAEEITKGSTIDSKLVSLIVAELSKVL
jgi:hypothetical protein